MRLIFGQDDYIAGFVSHYLGIAIVPPFTAIGFIDDAGQIRGGVVFNGFNRSNIDLTVYAPNVATRGAIRAVLHYVFIQLGCNRVTARTMRTNKTAQKMLPRLGFEFETISPQWFGPERADDAIVYRMTRKTALERWLNGLPTSANPS